MITVPSAGMQSPTLKGIHIRSPEDAHKVFYAVQLGHLPEITRRLDAQERKQLQSGNVYCWADKPAGEVAVRAASSVAGASAQGGPQYEFSIERWTEGLSWSASRIRDDFLIYFENEKKKGEGSKSSSSRARSLENQVHREGGRDMFIKQTYSAYRSDDFPDAEPASPSTPENEGGDSAQSKKKKPRKWHLNAYFTKSTEGNLATIDSIPFLRDMVVPEGMFRSARNSAKKSKAAHSAAAAAAGANGNGNGAGNVGGSGGGGAPLGEDTKGKRGRDGGPQRTYAPFPSGDRPPAHRPPRLVAPAPPAPSAPPSTRPAPYEMPPPPVPHERREPAFLPSLDMSIQGMGVGMGGGVGMGFGMDVDVPHSPFAALSPYGYPPQPQADGGALQGAHPGQGQGHAQGLEMGLHSSPSDMFPAYGYAPPHARPFSSSLEGALSPPSPYASSPHGAPHAHPQELYDYAQFSPPGHGHAHAGAFMSMAAFEFPAGGPHSQAAPQTQTHPQHTPPHAHAHAASFARAHNSFSPHSHSGSSGTDSPALSEMTSNSWHTPSPRPGSSGRNSAGDEDLSAYLPMPSLQPLPSSSSSTSVNVSVSVLNDATSHSTHAPLGIGGGGGGTPRPMGPPRHGRDVNPALDAAAALEGAAAAAGLGLGAAETAGRRRGSGSVSEAETHLALAPLHSLQRNHPYRRSPVDDRALRRLGPITT